ncbi:MAG: DNA internalization-related competence protein ComEC/Rec2 [Lachnospiraceae bacterium]
MRRVSELLVSGFQRPLCWMAAAMAVICIFRAYTDNFPEEVQKAASEKIILQFSARVLDKELKESYGSCYWQVTVGEALIRDESFKELEAGKLLCSFRAGEEEPLIGDKLVLEGEVSFWEKPSNPGQFDLGKWYRSCGIYGQLKKVRVLERKSLSGGGFGERAWQLRQWAKETLIRFLGEEEGALISAMLLGEKKEISGETKALYQRNGISHLLSISGLHLMLLGMGLYKLLQRLMLPVAAASLLSMSFMSIYCYFTGCSVSTFRATLMFCVLLLAKLIGRSYDSLSALGLSAIIQLILNPYAIDNSGFQLSYLAVIGVSAVVPRLNQLFSPKKKGIKALFVSLGVGLVTLPVLLYSFGTYPWHSVFLNLLVVPLMALLLGLGLILLLIAGLFSSASFLCTLPVPAIKIILFYYQLCCKAFERLPVWEGYQGRALWICIFLFSLGLILLLWLPHRLPELFCFLGLLACIQLLLMNPQWGMEITMLDVGQGDSVVIRSESGRVYLSDCGSSSVSKAGTYRLIPFLRAKGYDRIEGIFISHLDQDHYNGILELLESAGEEHISIETLFLPESVRGREADDNEADDREAVLKLSELLDTAKMAGVSVVYLKAGDSIIDGKTSFFCLHPGGASEGKRYESNNGSLVLGIIYGDFSLLLTGDVEKEGEKEILERIDQIGPFDVLKVAHHGSAGSSSTAFLERVRPVVSLISCGKNNSYGHPAGETLGRLLSIESMVLQTPDTGAITIRPGKDGSFTIERFTAR